MIEKHGLICLLIQELGTKVDAWFGFLKLTEVRHREEGRGEYFGLGLDKQEAR